METIKAAIVGAFSALAAYLSPISSVLFSILYVFLLNFAFGYLSGLAKGESFSLRKAFTAVKEASIFFLVVASVYIIGEKMGDNKGALQCITAVTYAITYFYAVNIFKNLSKLFPSSRGISFLYYVLSMEFIKKIPFMENFVKQEKADGKEGGE